MSSYKEPSFQERAALANKAKLDAVNRLRAKPKLDEATLAARRAAAEAREQAQTQARAEKIAARELEKAAKLERAQMSVEPDVPTKTDEERKLERDAKYAARKGRKGKK
ncbi:DUF6481 family protein [Sphingorhabdus sp.]|jgi:hypothetical protein|uniref:DUF6481 family protein n=1 Tax=Sphingorhabdus sp. TaxID=1902408 RepID=UPI0037CC6353